jgi:hypothetical protein
VEIEPARKKGSLAPPARVLTINAYGGEAQRFAWTPMPQMFFLRLIFLPRKCSVREAKRL